MKIKSTLLMVLLSFMSLSVFGGDIATIVYATPTAQASYEQGSQITVSATYPTDKEVNKVTVTLISYANSNWTGATIINSEAVSGVFNGSLNTTIDIPTDFAVNNFPVGSNTIQLVQIKIFYTEGGNDFHNQRVKIAATPVPVTGVTVTPETSSVSVDGTVTVGATLIPSDAVNQVVVWSSDATGIATVDASTGVVTGVAVGTANIIATTDEGSFKDTCKVTVIASAIAVTGISLDITVTELDKLDTLTLVPTFAPLSASNKDITWSSSAEAVATVSVNGDVIALALGTTTITATTDDGTFTATCDITVVPAAFVAFDDIANYVGPDFETGGQLEVTINYSMGANRTVGTGGVQFWLREIDTEGTGKFVVVAGADKKYVDTGDVVGTSQGTLTANIDLTDCVITDDLADNHFHWLWVKCVDDAGSVNQVDAGKEGVIKIIAATATGLELVEQRLSVYPNPAENTIFIEGMQGNVNVAVYSLAGKQLMNKNIGLERSIDVTQLDLGQYILQVGDDLGVNAQMISVK